MRCLMILLICFFFSLPSVFYGMEQKNINVVIFSSKETLKMEQVFKSFGANVYVFKSSFKEILADKKDINELADKIAQADIMVLYNQEEFGFLAKSNIKFKESIIQFFNSGGILIALIQWISSSDFADFCKKENLWYPAYEQIKAYSNYRIAFPSQLYIANEKISHPILEKPNKISGVVGYQNFGYLKPEGEDFYPLAICQNNSNCVGVMLQKNVIKNGFVIFSCLYEFIGDGKKTMKYPNEPLPRHSMLIIENIVDWASRKKL
ncbi:MAG: hypothetical protein A2017_18970 [Lentisphaerae bacterium GWF2_44_16]|nr:MAG: hypothetical protein A2017_18970 [Lentisphaerae bacterium GWF2_44_16]